MLLRATLISALLATPVAAELVVRFDEGAPKDRFTVTNTGGCAIGELQVTLDLSSAPAGLIFDVTGSGAGVEVFQPFELVAGAQHLRDLPVVLDGDTAITLPLKGLASGARVAFTIDIDDTGPSRPTVVSGSEIAGATAVLETASGTELGRFDTQAKAVVPTPACTS